MLDLSYLQTYFQLQVIKMKIISAFVLLVCASSAFATFHKLKHLFHGGGYGGMFQSGFRFLTDHL